MGRKAKLGRPSKLTRELQESLCEYLRRGYFVDTACALVGVHKDSIYQWLKDGARGKSKEAIAFSDAVKKAQAEAEAHYLDRIAIAGEWQASAWRLQYMFPTKYSRSKAEDPERAELERERLRGEIALLQAKIAELKQGGGVGPVTLNVGVMSWDEKDEDEDA